MDLVSQILKKADSWRTMTRSATKVSNPKVQGNIGTIIPLKVRTHGIP